MTFHRFLRRRGLSEQSSALYVRTVATIAARADRLALDLVTVDVPELDELANLWPWTRSSRQLLRSTLRWWWEYIERPDAPVAAIRVPTKPQGRCRALDERAARALERRARADGGPAGLAVLLGLYAGLRRAEIAEVRRDQLGDGWLTVVGKGDRTRHLPLHPVLASTIASYPPRGPWLFPAPASSSHVRPTTIWTWVKRLAADAGIPAMTTHQLRHTALATALDNTRDLRAVQQLAGHARPETTALYTRTTAQRLIEVVAAIDYGG
jgi:integrase